MSEKEQRGEVRRIAPELGELIDSMKEPINEFSWGAVTASDYEASLALARKIKASGVMKIQIVT